MQRFSLADLMSAIQSSVEAGTGQKCYDAIPQNVSGPYYVAEAAARRPENTKTMYADVFTVWFHVDGTTEMAQFYELVRQLEECFTQPIVIGEPFRLLSQTDQGLQKVKVDQTQEKKVIVYDFKVCYGFITK